jgi:hypothetical protein
LRRGALERAEERLDELGRVEKDSRVEKDKGRSVFIGLEPSNRAVVLAFEHPSYVLVSDSSFAMCGSLLADVTHFLQASRTRESPTGHNGRRDARHSG